jgi:hypothetical protein
MSDAGMEPDDWQADLLRADDSRVLMLCTRQGGKSQTAAGLALKEAFFRPGSLVLLLSPTLRQSGELFRDKVKRLYNALNRPVATVQESALSMELANGSRIVSLPGEEGTIRGYSGARLIVIDEAARVTDELYRSVRPMLTVSKGRLIAMSTPFGQRGWFFETWSGTSEWKRVRVTAAECPRIDKKLLEEERQELGPMWFRQEYECSFESVVGALFTEEVIQGLFSNDVQPLNW